MLYLYRILLVGLALALFLPSTVRAQQTVHGTLSGSLGPGTYIVDGDIQVLAGQSLNINPGTTFLHSGHYTWTINGEFSAIGSESQAIRFIRQFPYEAHKWGGIRFQPYSTSQGLEWCEMDYCKNYAYPNTYGGAVYTYLVNNISIRNCTFTNGQAYSGGAIYCYYSNMIIIDNCTIAYNTASNGGGIFFNQCNDAVITNCLIVGNSSTNT